MTARAERMFKLCRRLIVEGGAGHQPRIDFNLSAAKSPAMTTISATATSGADGWLQLQVPEALRGQPLEIVAVLQPAKVADLDAPVRRQRAYAALEQLADLGGIAGIAEPAAWQRALRMERPLPGRED